NRPISAPPPYAPTRKPASANRDADNEKPGAPTRANAAKTTLPVMFATKTRPRARIETASTTPVTTVSVSSSAYSGPYAGSATSIRANPGVLPARTGLTPLAAGRSGRSSRGRRSPAVPARSSPGSRGPLASLSPATVLLSALASSIPDPGPACHRQRRPAARLDPGRAAYGQ